MTRAEREYNPDLIGERIRSLREERSMSKIAFARLIGSSTGTVINNWEMGTRLPTAYSIFQLAKACGVSADWLLGLTDERRRP